MHAAIVTPPVHQIIQRPKALIIEDDITLEPIWEHVLKLVHKDMSYHWVTNAQDGEFALRKTLRNNDHYDIVISDIYLSSNKTGIDLWNQYGQILKGRMLLVSSISHNKLLKSMDPDKPSPLYIRKPLIVTECIEAVYGLICSPD